jgi:NADH-quinone oxidoreductase E subunit
MNAILTIQDKEVFEFNKENELEIEKIFSKYPSDGKRSATLPLLDLAQRQNGGWLSDSALQAVADKLNLPKLTIKAVASFYTMFHLKPVGKNVIEICKTLSCKLNGADKIQEKLENILNIKLGETDKDENFTLLPCECLGACVNAPVIKINDDYYEDLSSDDAQKIIEEIQSGKKPKIGSYKNRKSSEPIEL